MTKVSTAISLHVFVQFHSTRGDAEKFPAEIRVFSDLSAKITADIRHGKSDWINGGRKFAYARKTRETISLLLRIGSE